ncbi:FAD-binding oxidoreductase [Allobranchiibius sp. GilTou73]|uniref:FAD-binding oxidoreductase n=1 Tax=Allobranchiibius sp. GilTou73 TaxID=2904523 RepID=UPI001F44DF42|nr:FAD-binding oxidoreductase [Allobranchiibius sp. GilTou73]UIJ35725.1 FAD-binding oxidoreductase [Allobranchiibius sp. GilTou73]
MSETAQKIAPHDLEEASRVLRKSESDGHTVLFTGGGTKAQWGGIPDPTDLQISTDHLNVLISHHPGEMTAAVGAGMPLQTLQTQLAEEGQWLALDPATERHGATIGGLLATGDAGPRRLRFGTMRDLAIGTTLLLADGTIAHSGSHVIKNVAGYDLTKLFYGSLGSLGLIGEVIVRLHPLNASSATVLASATAHQATVAAAALRRSGVEPTAVEWLDRAVPDEDPMLLVRVDGSADGTAAGSARVAKLLTDEGLSPHVLDQDEADRRWAAVAEAATGGPDDTVVRAGALPGTSPQLIESLHAIADEHGVSASVASSTGLGLHTAVLRGSARAQADVARRWRDSVETLSGSCSLRSRPAAVADRLAPFGTPPSSAALLRAVKLQFDPLERCAPGRFRGWY